MAQIAYIRGGNGSYIDTGITADNTTRVIIWARNFNPGCGAFFGSCISDSSGNFALIASSGTQTGNIRIQYAASVATIATDQFIRLSGYHKYELYQGVLIIDDVTIARGATGTFSNNLNIHLFGRNLNGTHAAPITPIDICACKIYKNGTLVRNYTAVNSPSVGLYDSVSGNLFTNAGSGSLTYGTFNELAYIPLEYIVDSGDAYFDSGIYGSNTLDYVCKYTTNLTAPWPSLFSCQTTGSSKRYGIMFGNATTAGSRLYFLYGSASKTYNNSSTMNGSAYVAVKVGVDHYLYRNNTQITKQTHTADTFTTDYHIYVGANNDAGHIGSASIFQGSLCYLGFGSQRNFVPAMVNGVAGFYDTYNDNFYASASGVDFVAGPKLQDALGSTISSWRRRLMKALAEGNGPLTGYTIYGSPTISNGMMTLNSYQSGIITPEPFSPGSNPWEIQTRVLYEFKRYAYFLVSCLGDGTEAKGVGMQMDIGNTIRLLISTNGTSWNVGSNTGITRTYPADTWVWIKVGWDGSNYYHSFSTDNETWSTNTRSNSSPVYPGKYILFGEGSSARYSQSTWDLNNTRIYINNRLWWKPF